MTSNGLKLQAARNLFGACWTNYIGVYAGRFTFTLDIRLILAMLAKLFSMLRLQCWTFLKYVGHVQRDQRILCSLKLKIDDREIFLLGQSLGGFFPTPLICFLFLP